MRSNCRASRERSSLMRVTNPAACPDVLEWLATSRIPLSRTISPCVETNVSPQRNSCGRWRMHARDSTTHVLLSKAWHARCVDSLPERSLSSRPTIPGNVERSTCEGSGIRSTAINPIAPPQVRIDAASFDSSHTKSSSSDRTSSLEEDSPRDKSTKGRNRNIW